MFTTVRIKELGQVVTGSTPPTKEPENFGQGYPFIKPPDLFDGSTRNILVTATEISQTGFNTQSKKLLPAYSTCVVCIGTIGKLGLTTRPSFSNQQINSVIPDMSRFDPHFIYYLMRMTIPTVKQLNAGSASGRENVNKSTFENIEVRVPPLPTQRRIASILSTYDDLIENNTRRIAILEEMARRLYEEWFVKFRFPGHEEVSFKETELGMMPVGWEVTRLDQVVELNPKTKVPKGGEKLFVPMSALSENNMTIGGLQLKAGNSGAKLQNDDTLLARITPCLENGKTGFVDFLPPEQPTACGSTEFIVLRSKSLCSEMVYLLARSDSFRDVAIKSMAGADGRQRVRVESLKGYLVPQPDKATLSQFSNIVSTMFRQMKTLKRKNSNLRAQRDLLLPKLVSGQIDVSEIELLDTEEQAA